MGLRVLMLHNDYQHIGGETVSTRTEARALADAGVDVDLCEVSNSELDGLSALSTARRILSDSEAADLVDGVVARTRPDIVHVQNMFPLLGSGAVRALTRAGVPWVRSLRNYRLACLAGTHFLAGKECFKCTSATTAVAGVAHGCYRGRQGSLLALGYARREKRAVAGSTLAGHIAVSQHVADQLVSILDADLPLWVKPNAVAEGAVPGAGGDPILFVGRLDTYKGADLVVELARQLPHRPFHIVGQGDLESEVSEAVGRLPNVRWSPRLEPAEVLTEMGRAAVVVVPSRWSEPFGRVAAEALSVGTPPLVMDRGGLGEIVSGLRPGLALGSDSVDVWARAVEELASLPTQESRQLRARCRERYEARYTTSANARMLTDIYHQVLAGA